MTVSVNIHEDLWTCLNNIVAEGTLTDPEKETISLLWAAMSDYITTALSLHASVMIIHHVKCRILTFLKSDTEMCNFVFAVIQKQH